MKPILRVWVVVLASGFGVLAGCGDNRPLSHDAAPDGAQAVALGGTVSGLDGTGLVLQNNGGDDLTITADGAFTFPTTIAPGTAYAVTVKTQPTDPTQTCTVANGTGTASGSAVTSVAVTCATSQFTVGVTVTGLVGTGLVLENNLTDDLAVPANGTYTFATALDSGAAYAVSVLTQPTSPSQTCTVAAGTGTIGNGPVTAITVDCSTDEFTIGGTVTGLAGTLVLQNNGGDDITLTGDGPFAFPTTLLSGDAYAVSILTQPGTPAQTCVLSNETGSVTNADITTVAVVCTTNTYALGGAIAGLAGDGLALANNGVDLVTPDATDTSYVFPTAVASGTAYAVTVTQQPHDPTQLCTVANATGTVTNAAISNANVACVTQAFTVGGTVTGLAGSGLVLQQGADSLPVAADGTFTFPTAVLSGQPFAVSVSTNPSSPTQSCTVSGGTGTVGGQNITSVTVNCATDRFTVGGTISGLRAPVTLQNNGGDSVVVSADGTFSFPTTVASGASYAVTVSQQPTNPWQTCTVANGSGPVIAGDITTVSITCTTNRYTVGGTVSGLAGSDLTLTNGSDTITVSSTTPTFTFPTTVESGATFNVTVTGQPHDVTQTCTVDTGTGAGTIAGANVTSVQLTCVTNRYAVSANVSGLSGTGLQVSLTYGTTTLATPIGGNGVTQLVNATSGPASGTSYTASITGQPLSPTQSCVISSGGTGTVTNAAITVGVQCTTTTFRVRAAVTGLSGTGLQLRNNGGDTLAVSADGTVTFVTPVASGATYNVTVFQAPSGPSQTCTVMSGSGIVGNGDVTVTVNCATNTFTVGGTVSGLVGGVELQNNGGDNLVVNSDGSFTFPTPVLSGATYAVTVASHTGSISQTCNVTNGNGTIGGSNVTNVAIACTTDRFAVSATVSGLASGNTLVLRNNNTNDLSFTTNTTQSFTTTIPSGGTYSVSVATNGPISQTCLVTNGSGTVANAPVTATVACSTNAFDVRATVVGLGAGKTVVLQNNGGGDISVNASGTVTFSPQVASGQPYAVTVLTQPNNQICLVSNGSGTVGGANVTATVNCYDGCAIINNTAGIDLPDNNWFDTCASTVGNTVRVILIDTNGTVVYSHAGPKVGTWTPPDQLTSTAQAFDQYDSANHNRIITFDNADQMMIAGKSADNSGCGGSLGNGYGIVVYAGASSYYSNIRVLIQPYNHMISEVGPRYFAPWGQNYEISYSGSPMSSCESLVPFIGRAIISISP